MSTQTSPSIGVTPEYTPKQLRMLEYRKNWTFHAIPEGGICLVRADVINRGAQCRDCVHRQKKGVCKVTGNHVSKNGNASSCKPFVSKGTKQ
jgi:hypothetical protein